MNKQGKEFDCEFVSDYIQDCLLNEIMTDQEIIQRAKARIEQIDEQLKAKKATQEIRQERCQLLDVISSFCVGTKEAIPDIFLVHDLSNCQKISAILCHERKVFVKDPRLSSDLMKQSVKEMLTLNIIERQEDYLYPGSNYPNFQTFYGQHS